MKQNVTILLLGVLIGAVLMTAAPSQAHHYSSYSQLSNRLLRLEAKTSSLDSAGYLRASYIDKPIGCSYDDVALWNFSGLTC